MLRRKRKELKKRNALDNFSVLADIQQTLVVNTQEVKKKFQLFDSKKENDFSFRRMHI